MKKLALSLERKSHQYDILIGEAVLSNPVSFSAIKQVNRIHIISNETVADLYLEQLKKSLSSYSPNSNLSVSILKDGEEYKSLDSFSMVIDDFIDNQLRRNDLVIALGGGVVGDLAGFSAACYQRGIDFIQIPTSLLAMVDSSVGGKTAVNHFKGKNLIGAFHQPLKVISDISVLKTLPQDQFIAGMAEVIKAAIIYDKAFFHWLTQNADLILQQDSVTLTEMVYRSCEIKAAIVAQDEMERGTRAWLNLGHTFGHAIETIMGYGNILHGEAVAIGMVLAAKFSHQQRLLSKDDMKIMINGIHQFKLPASLPAEIDVSAMAKAMILDKKNLDGNIRLVLPLAIGKVTINQDYSVQDIEAFLRKYE